MTTSITLNVSDEFIQQVINDCCQYDEYDQVDIIRNIYWQRLYSITHNAEEVNNFFEKYIDTPVYQYYFPLGREVIFKGEGIFANL